VKADSRSVFHDEDVDPLSLEGERIAVLGYGIQGRAQALNLRDAGVPVVVGNRADRYRDQAVADGFDPVDIAEAAARATLVLVLLPDEAQPAIYRDSIRPRLNAGDGLVFAHGFAIRYALIEPPEGVDVMLLAPRMPGRYVRDRYVEGWGVPAFVGVERDATGRAWPRLLGLARAIGATRAGAIRVSFAEETELDHFSEHFVYPLVFRALELAFEALVDAGYPPEAALMELHGSGELGEVLGAAGRDGLYEMIQTHASPACQVGMARHWDTAIGAEADVRARIADVLAAIRSGAFARALVEEQAAGYPELRRWRRDRPARLEAAERSLQRMLRRRV
jgi:ketol-acid reductoisomerase